MDPPLFDQLSTLFAARRLSRRQALAGGGSLAAGLLAATGLGADASSNAPSAEDRLAADTRAPVAPPVGAGITVVDAPPPNATAIAPATAPGAKPLTFLFLQSFETGSLVPKPGSPGRYTLTLKQGLGDTVYFSDRPAKIVGTLPTLQFLNGLGFPPNNPPNAALVGQRSPTHRDIVVVELFNPIYDASSTTLTYEVTLLQDWRKLGETFAETPDDAAQLPRQFTAAHLFIDDCPDARVTCWTNAGYYDGDDYVGDLGVRGMCFDWNSLQCLPCGGVGAAWAACNRTFPACHNNCIVHLQT